MTLIICLATIIIAGAAAIAGAVWFVVELFRDDGRHAAPKTADPGPVIPSPGGPGIGSMQLDDDRPYLIGRDAITYTDDHGTVIVRPWDPPHGLDGPGFDDATVFYNGHTLTCLRPDDDHPGACPEEGDGPDDHDWPVPDLPPAEPVAAGPDVIDAVLALEAEDPAAAGWTDQLLADLRDAPTALDGPTSFSLIYPVELERLADTGEIHLAGVRADYAAELDDQDDDAAEFISRMASAAAEIRLQVNGLA